MCLFILFILISILFIITTSIIITITITYLFYIGIYKADIGIKNGLITGIGKAGNPDMMTGVTDGMIVGVNTEAIAGEGLIVTAGAVDSHIHFICPQICYQAISSGITTLLGGGTGPASGTWYEYITSIYILLVSIVYLNYSFSDSYCIHFL